MDIREIRRLNLNRLIGSPGERGRISDFSQKYNFDHTYVSQVLNGHKKMGEKSARKMESAMGLPPGTLDVPPDSTAEPMDENEIALLAAFRSVKSQEVKAGFLRILQAAADSRK